MAQVEQNALLAEIAKDEDHAYYDTLSKNEDGINWLAFAAKIYRKSHSTSTITSYCKGICAFRAMLLEEKTTLSELVKVEKQTKAAKEAMINKIYEHLDSFVTYCDATRHFAPRTTRNYYLAVVKVLKFTGIELIEKRLEDIDLPTPQDLLDEYPKNEVIQSILKAAMLRIRGFVETMIDTGFEPTDTAQLQVKDIRFEESPPRITKNREKTGHKLEGFLNTLTVETLKQIIRIDNKQPEDYLFTGTTYNNYTLRSIRDTYNLACAKAGFGELKRIQTKQGPKYRGLVEKIEGHKFGKYHLKIYKKRWFTLAISAGVPEYVAQAMLGRGAYLKQYHIQPLEMRQEFARKILKSVNPYAGTVNDAEKRKLAAQSLGLDDMTPEQMQKLKEFLWRKINEPETANKLMGESA